MGVLNATSNSEISVGFTPVGLEPTTKHMYINITKRDYEADGELEEYKLDDTETHFTMDLKPYLNSNEEIWLYGGLIPKQFYNGSTKYYVSDITEGEKAFKAVVLGKNTEVL